jgi:hypothetical protein
MSIRATEIFEFTPPEELEEQEEYYDPFVFNEDGNVDLDLNGKARIRGESLGVDGKLTVSDDAEIEGDLIVDGKLTVTGDANITGGSTSDNLNVTGISTFTGLVDANGGLNVTGTSAFNSNVGIGITSPETNLHVVGNTLFTSGITSMAISSSASSPPNSHMTFELEDNSTLRIRVTGTDGVSRVGTVTLS